MEIFETQVHKIGTWNINIVDESDISSNNDENDIEKVADTFDGNSVNDLDDAFMNLNNDKEGEENNVESPKANVKDSQPAKEDNVSDLSCPPGFEHLKRGYSRTCSTSFSRHRNKDIKDIRITTLDRLWFDHIPILLHCCKHDFGLSNNQKHEEVLSKSHEALKSLKILDEKTEAGSASNDDRDLRINLLQEVDNLINQKRRGSSINGISHGGVWVSEPHLIKEVFLNFYKQKFQANDSLIDLPSISTSSRLNDGDRALLEAHVSLDEIKDAVWDCGSDKAPGPNSYTFAFVKRYWDLLNSDIHDFVASFLAT
ncbi:hypothetical protein Tco_0290881 [Tanacetum coccineum]